MSQVDYLHFFNNIIWNLVQLFIMYLFISVVYVQSFYKIFRFRLLNYNILSEILKNKDYYLNKCLNKFKEIRKFFTNSTQSFKFNKSDNNINKVTTWFYE